MPIYEYECLTCGVKFEKRQSFSEEPKAQCPNGHTKTRRLLAAPAIVFKGSGFYVTDSKGKNSANGASPKSEKAETKSEPTGDKSSEKSTEKSAEKA